jgi:hypothetical protein
MKNQKQVLKLKNNQTMNDKTFIYKTSGVYLGFIRNGFLYSRDGIFLGWIDDDYVWGASGQFKGFLIELSGSKYILTKRFVLKPSPRSPKSVPAEVALPNPPANVPPISLPVDLIDAFN